MIGCGILVGAGAMAASITVTDGGDAGTALTCTLRQAIEAANSNAVNINTGNCAAGSGADTIVLSGLSGTITLATGQIVVSETVTLQGPGASQLTISGNHAGRIFDVVDSVNDNTFQTLTIEGLTLRDGRVSGENGGCIRAENPDTLLVLRNSIVTGCEATAITAPSLAGGNGGAIHATGQGDNKYDTPSVLLEHSTVSGNKATFLGGGVAAFTSRLASSNVSDNILDGIAHAPSTSGPVGPFGFLDGVSGGGGVFSYSVISNNSTISGNRVSASVVVDPVASDQGGAFGGGVLAFIPVMLNSTVSGNSVHAPHSALGASYNLIYGGGVATKYGISVIINSTISGNLASGNPVTSDTGDIDNAVANVIAGGGVWTAAKYAAAPVGMMNSTITGNRVAASTVLGATNTLGAGGIAFWDYAPSSVDRGAFLYSSIVANSIGGPDIGCLDFGSACATPLPISGAMNLVQTSVGVTLPPDTLTANPQLAPLADNGGTIAGAPGAAGTASVKTHALSPTSPAVNSGGLLSPGFPLDFDERGPGYPRTSGSRTDIGAYELNTATPVPALSPLALGLLSALLGILGMFGRKIYPRSLCRSRQDSSKPG